MKSHIKDQPQAFDRFGARWTPTQILLDSAGVERHRIEGYLPVEDFLAELELGLGKLAFAHEDYAEAEKRFHDVDANHHDAACAAEACYWAGAARFKASHRGEALAESAKLLQERYPGTEWARRASVYLESAPQPRGRPGSR